MSINRGERAILTPVSGQFAQIQRHLVRLAVVWGNPGELFGGWGHYGLRSNPRIILPHSGCIQKNLRCPLQNRLLTACWAHFTLGERPGDYGFVQSPKPYELVFNFACGLILDGVSILEI